MLRFKSWSYVSTNITTKNSDGNVFEWHTIKNKIFDQTPNISKQTMSFIQSPTHDWSNHDTRNTKKMKWKGKIQTTPSDIWLHTTHCREKKQQ